MLVVAYVLLHYVFVSQTAHLLALFGVFLDVGVKLGVPAAPLAFQLLFATNYFSAITPQGSSANLLFAGSGFLSQRDAVPPRRADDGVQHGAVSGRRHTLAAAGRPLREATHGSIGRALRENPELAIFLTLALGFLIGRVRIGSSRSATSSARCSPA